jgi:hypothetical protein
MIIIHAITIPIIAPVLRVASLIEFELHEAVAFPDEDW